MFAVPFREAGGPETLVVEELPDPVPGPGDVLIEVTAAGLNSADILQRLGRANLPLGASNIFGMEVSGTVIEVGVSTSGIAVGDKVVALLDSGGYATKVAAPAGQVLPLPQNVDLMTGAGIPEVAATLVSNVCMLAGYKSGETVLIHGASGGIGTFGIQFLKALGARVAVTASTSKKLQHAKDLGADIRINYRKDDFAAVMEAAGGADIILDTVAGPYLPSNIRALTTFGRIVTIGRQGGAEGTLDFASLMKKKATVSGTLLRDRPAQQKAEIMRQTQSSVWPLLESGAIRTRVDRTFPLSDVANAHAHFGSKEHIGKVLLDCRL